MVIGGAEDKVRERVILTRFVALAGGPDARIAVISTASSLGPVAGEIYRKVFTELGATEVHPLHATTRDQANDEAAVAASRDATGIFMTGGNQLRLSSTIGGTRLAQAILDRHRHGAVVAGTSAGASAMSSHMVAFGASGATPKQRMVQMAAGLGVLPGVIVDQHFQQRNRLGRLLASSPRTRACSAWASTRTPPGSSARTWSWRSSAGGASPSSTAPASETDAWEVGGAPADHDQQRRAPLAAGRLPIRPSAPRPGRGPHPARGPRQERRPHDPVRGCKRPATASASRRRTPATEASRAAADRDAGEGEAAPPARPDRPCASSRRASCAGRTTGSASRSSGCWSTWASSRSSPRTPSRASTRRSIALLPTMEEHACSLGRRGGFFSRLRDGTWMGHVAEHIALELQSLAGTEVRNGKTRSAGPYGRYDVIYEYREEQVGLEAGQIAVALVNHLVDPATLAAFDLEAELERLIRIAERSAFGPSTQAIIDEAVSRDIPWIRLDRHSAWSSWARASTSSASGPR